MRQAKGSVMIILPQGASVTKRVGDCRARCPWGDVPVVPLLDPLTPTQELWGLGSQRGTRDLLAFFTPVPQGLCPAHPWPLCLGHRPEMLSLPQLSSHRCVLDAIVPSLPPGAGLWQVAGACGTPDFMLSGFVLSKCFLYFCLIFKMIYDLRRKSRWYREYKWWRKTVTYSLIIQRDPRFTS